MGICGSRVSGIPCYWQTDEFRRIPEMRLTVIGTGNMGTALLAGMLSGGLLSPADVILFDIDRDKAAQTASLYGCTAAGDAGDAVRDATHVLLAVKPQYFDAALRPMTEHLRDNTILLSVAA